ncbi:MULTISPECIES: aminopeptidase [Brevibacillus]|uniref:Aminopeptidase n=2 Tax=Brevibacillus TaxID=55080 RepID=A0A1I3RFX4_9BACL|nr:MULTISPECIES: aminopeptidase [Brevibacillus]MEC2130338.1 aminopeptidase [Brevibacillus centrosporus]MED1794570.1 aminopeptidase [Brevibacillus nitrificans]MED4909189.1 aminopeptidase [Brevibacillus centrosporus]RNB71047.1 aminopeptidase [Brevibacillus centrosporus]RNB78699.1 aminopeptidase [Brevibacillus nitrificans]
MADPRINELASRLVRYSLNLQKGEKVLIENTGLQPELVRALVREAFAVGALPLVTLKDQEVNRALYQGTSEEHMALMAKYEYDRMKDMDAYIAVRAYDNINEYADVSEDKMGIYSRVLYQPVHTNERVPNKRWVVLRYPNKSMAQLSSMSLEGFEDFYFSVCNLDYAKMSNAMTPLKELMERTDRVRIVGPKTDLRFSIKGINAIKCDGKRNIPDGEVYTAPVRDSVEGTIFYNAATNYNGISFTDVQFTFKEGKIVEATSSNTKALNDILDTDEGARYIGEFAIGFNPHILHPMLDILFDEKIAGSFHFTPGNAYTVADNGNRSSVHWDLVQIQRPEYGGGEIWFDDVLIRKDGRFVLPELEGLNPENLV